MPSAADPPSTSGRLQRKAREPELLQHVPENREVEIILHMGERSVTGKIATWIQRVNDYCDLATEMHHCISLQRCESVKTINKEEK